MTEGIVHIQKVTASTPLVTVSAEAESHLRQQLNKQGGQGVVRVAVKKSGCSGFKYDLSIVAAPQAEDYKIELVDFVIYLDPQSLPLLQGTHLVLEKKGLNAALRFENPNASNHCGCGESFSV